MYRNWDDKGLETLPDIPDHVEFVLCNYNKLKELPNLPNILIGLYCNNNQLKELPNLPNTLTSLECANNQLEILPDLPVRLRRLECANNQLERLPDLHDSWLNELDCGNNQLKTLPKLPPSLYKLYCENNQLKTILLPESNNLQDLNCANNPIKELPPLPKLRTFTVSFDQFHLVKPVIDNKNIIVNVIDSNHILMDDIEKYNKEWKTIIVRYRRKIKFNLPKTKERFKTLMNIRLSLLPPTTPNPVTGKIHRVKKKSPDNNSTVPPIPPNPPIEMVAANLDTKILSYIRGNGRKLKSRKIRKNNTSKKQNKTPRSK
jgi:Leucine-rich repeat (LRR) protein